MKKTVLLTGGAGYIGSHTAYLLHTLGYKVVIIDNFVHKQSFNHAWAEHVISGNIADIELLQFIFTTFSIHAVMHFAGYIEVGVSVQDPARFYENNISNTLRLLDVMKSYHVHNIIFSSTCAIYGNPVNIPIDENHPYAPLSPYAKTKLAIEYALQDYARAYDLRYVALRYFNAAGALPEHNLGESHSPETHVIPLLLKAAQSDQLFTIFGDDYDTPDGTCIRDYVHVYDIARAHVKALEYLAGGGASDAFNLGSGVGYSVRQLVEVAKKICNKDIHTVIHPRRPGDASVLVANADKIEKILGWIPEYSDLEIIIKDAWQWEQKR